MTDVKRGTISRKQGWYVVRTSAAGRVDVVAGPCDTAPKLSTFDETKLRYWDGSGGWHQIPTTRPNRGLTMTLKCWGYLVSGSASDGQTWEVRGEVRSEFSDAWTTAMRDAFDRLTDGKAVFGYPGMGGCRGPYDVHRVVIEQKHPDSGARRPA